MSRRDDSPLFPLDRRENLDITKTHRKGRTGRKAHAQSPKAKCTHKNRQRTAQIERDLTRTVREIEGESCSIAGFLFTCCISEKKKQEVNIEQKICPILNININVTKILLKSLKIILPKLVWKSRSPTALQHVSFSLSSLEWRC